MKEQYMDNVISEIRVLNDEDMLTEKMDVGGNAACWLGCISFCILSAGTLNMMASVTTML